MGVVFDEQTVYKLGQGQKMSSFRRAAQRDPILKMYEEDMGSPWGKIYGSYGARDVDLCT